MPLSIGIFPEGSENGRILGPAFWCWRTTFELIFGIAQSGRGATISSATCSRRTPKCSQLMLALNTYSFQTIKLKLAAFLPSAAPTVQLREYLFLHLFDCKPQNIVAVVVHESATAQEAVAVGWSGSISKKRNGDHFFGVENSKKRVRSGLKNGPGIRTRFWCL